VLALGGAPAGVAALGVAGSTHFSAYSFVLNGAVIPPSQRSAGLELFVAETMDAHEQLPGSAFAFRLNVTASYAAADAAYRHLFDVSGLRGVLHATETQTEFWVGNANGDSSNCARGWAVHGPGGNFWSPNHSAVVSLNVFPNGTIGPLTVDGAAPPPAAEVPMYMGISACYPLFIAPVLDLQDGLPEPWLLGSGGNPGFNDNWVGSIEGVAVDYPPPPPAGEGFLGEPVSIPFDRRH